MDSPPRDHRTTTSARRKGKRTGRAFSVLPFLDAAMDAAQGEQLLFVVNQLGAALGGQRIVFQQEDGFLRANLLAETTEDATEHVDLKFARHLFGVGAIRRRTRGTRRRNLNRLGRADEFAELAGDA